MPNRPLFKQLQAIRRLYAEPSTSSAVAVDAPKSSPAVAVDAPKPRKSSKPKSSES